MKKTLVFVAVLLFFINTSYIVLAKETGNTENIQERAQELISENTAENTLRSFFDSAKEHFFGFSKRFGVLLFATIVLGVIATTGENQMALYAGEICLSSVSFSIIATVCENIMTAMSYINAFILSMLPVMISLYGSSVGVQTATLSYKSTLVFLNLSSTIMSQILIPAVKIIVVFATLTHISRSFDFSGIGRSIGGIVKWGFGIVMCVMSGVIYFQSVISVAGDSLSGRAIRYAAQSLIPVIGNVVAESSRTVSESLKLVRGVTGVSGIFAIITAVASPIMAIFVCKIFFGIAGALSRLLSCYKTSQYFTEITTALNLLLGACIAVSLVLILILGLFSKVVV